MPAVQVGDEVELTIEKLSFNGGRGVARLEGFVFFVPFTAPKDRILARVEVVKKSYGEASLLKVLSPGSGRREPPCPIFSKCGGCQWQHLNYDEQLRQKELIFREMLRNAISPTVPVTIVASPSEFRYRHRVQVQVLDGKVGFFARQSNDLVETDDCFIADPSLFSDTTLSSLRELRGKHKVELSVAHDGRVTLTNLRDQTPPFTQVNPQMNEILRGTLADIFVAEPTETLLDLFCGGGNLSLPILNRAKNTKGIGVESNRMAVERAQAAARRLGLTERAQYLCEDALKYVGRAEVLPSTTVLVDPPRAGLTKHAISEICRLEPLRILYVSCHIATLARDLDQFSTLGYRARAAWGLDMFPQTDYLEGLIELTPRAT